MILLCNIKYIFNQNNCDQNRFCLGIQNIQNIQNKKKMPLDV